MLVLRGQLLTGQLLLDRDLRAIQVMAGPDGPVIYAATGRDGGISAYRLDPGGGLARLVDSALFSGLAPTSRLTGLTPVERDGQPQLIFGQTAAGHWLSQETDPDDPLGKSLRSSPSEPPTGPPALLDLGAGRVMVMSRGEGGVWAKVSSSSGQTTTAQFLADPDIGANAAPGMGEQHLALARAPGGGVLVGDMASDSVTHYRVAASGALTQTDRIDMADGIGIAQPTALAAIRAYGSDWVVVAAAGTGSLSVLNLTPDGALEPTDHVLDNRETRFDGVEALAAVLWRGQVVVAAGGRDDGLSLFTLLPTGALVHRQTLIHGDWPGLEDVTALQMVAIGNRLEVFVAGAGDTGLTQFGWTADGPTGRVLTDRGTGATQLTGSSGDDILVGLGRDTLKGGSGDDILVADSGGDLWGGSGADRFIPTNELAVLRIRDFERGVDRLDLSHLPWLRDATAISLSPLSNGVMLSHNDLQMTILSRDGATLRADDLWAGGFDTPDRLLFDPPPLGVIRQGSKRDDMITGGPGADTINAGGGNDVAWTTGGNDRVSGGAGHDRLYGGTGADTLWGGDGNDELGGFWGPDALWGGDGQDYLWGQYGNDTLRGGRDADLLGGFEGNDNLNGEQGRDVLWGYRGDDSLVGGDGNDEMWGSYGTDTLSGGPGNDTLGGYFGRDSLWAGAGDDLVWGGDDNDRLEGGAGADTLLGGLGNDHMGGGADADWLAGGPDRDRLTGGAGPDTLLGGGGEDTFIFGPLSTGGHGRDVIRDFTPGSDVLHLSGLDLLPVPRAVSGGTLIDTGHGTVLLEGISPDDLLDGDILLF